jgi:hypothetical protein
MYPLNIFSRRRQILSFDKMSSGTVKGRRSNHSGVGRVQVVEIQSINSFPFSIRQRDPNWCIPANVEAVTKYLQPDSGITQERIWGQFWHTCVAQNRRPEDINLGWMKECLEEWKTEFSWARPEHIANLGDFTAFVASTRGSVGNNIPPIISVPVGLPWRDGVPHYHMLTVVGYDDQSFLVHDSAARWYDVNPRQIPTEQIRSDVLQANRGQPDLLALARRA